MLQQGDLKVRSFDDLSITVKGADSSALFSYEEEHPVLDTASSLEDVSKFLTQYNGKDTIEFSDNDCFEPSDRIFFSYDLEVSIDANSTPAEVSQFVYYIGQSINIGIKATTKLLCVDTVSF